MIEYKELRQLVDDDFIKELIKNSVVYHNHQTITSHKDFAIIVDDDFVGYEFIDGIPREHSVITGLGKELCNGVMMHYFEYRIEGEEGIVEQHIMFTDSIRTKINRQNNLELISKIISDGE